jgi:cell cycle sensor histidine kinase DivJ
MGDMPFVILSACCGLAALLAWRHAAECGRAARQAREAEAASIRLLRLTAGELRGPALALKGHAEQGSADQAALIALARRLLDVADGLLGQVEQPDAPRRLTEETLHIGPLLEFVVSQVSAQLGPGRRAWHIAGDLNQVALLADRRAVHQVLLRVVTAAALATREGDWIDIKADRADQGWALVVEDEGTGLAVDRLAERGPESRGIGVGLALARSLMQAHGGSLTIESAPRVGTRAVIRFPRERLVRMSPQG